MKNTIFLLLSLLLFYTTAFSENSGGVNRLQGSGIPFHSFPDEIVTPPVPVEPPQCLKVGSNNLLLIPVGQRQYAFKLEIIPTAEKFMADHLPGIIQWTKTGGDSAPVETPDNPSWKPIKTINKQEGEIVPLTEENSQYGQPDQPVEPPTDPPMEAMWLKYTLEQYTDTTGQILQFFSEPGTLYCTLTIKENTGYAELEGLLRISYRVQITVGNETADFHRQLNVNYRLINKNYILEKSRTSDSSGYLTAITYYDGLGREEQSIAIAASPEEKDVILPVYYDSIGRNSRAYLPFAAKGQGKFQKDAFEQQETYYTALYGANPYAYSETRVNAEGQVVRSNVPGKAWKIDGDHTTRTIYRKNRGNDYVTRYELGETSVSCTGFYEEGVLNVVETINPDGHISLSYTDIDGNLIAEEARGENESLFTYYVYDDLGRKRYILPPSRNDSFRMGVEELTDLQSDCYYVEYDKYGRIYKQYIPGSGYTISLYDARGRLAFSQNTLQREKGKWSFTKYDAFDRPVISGICSGTETEFRQTLANQEFQNEKRGTAIHGYTNRVCPTNITSEDCLEITYYDDYSWPGQETVAWSAADALDEGYSDRITGQITGTKTRVLGDTVARWLLKANYYDSRYLLLQMVSQLYPSGIEITSNKHSFGGGVLTAKVKQIVKDQVTEYLKYFDYDQEGRLIKIRQKITGDTLNEEVVLVKNTYDELGRLISYSLHNEKETIQYDYHIAGMLSSVSSPRFSYRLEYENTEVIDAVARYNGNINAMHWKHENEQERAYLYNYDPFGRLTSASFKENNGLFWNNSTGKYNVSGLSYDGNGNIKSLKRFDGEGSLKHDFTYHYSNPASRNALSQVTDKGVNSSLYRYDNLGNMVYDGRRDIHISYNILNLPDTISQGSDNISYIYTAGGEKLAQRIGSSYTYYRGVMIYAGNTLSYIKQPEGLIRKDGPYYTYNYFLKDHLGSTRVLLEAVEDSLRTVQTTDYYPFGLSFENNNLNRNKYLYTGKEFQDVSLGGRTLSMYDFGARFYDPEIGRWFNIDPALQLATPYGFCGNNPILNVDPDGRFAFLVQSIFIGAVTNVLSQMGSGKITDLKSFLSAGIVGGIIGGISGAIGNSVAKALESVEALTGGFANGAITGAAQGASSGLLGGIGNTMLNGGSIGDGFRHGLFDGGKGMLMSGIIGGVTSGLAAKEKGFKFWNGHGEINELGESPLNSAKTKEAKEGAKIYKKNKDEIKKDMNSLQDGLNSANFNDKLKSKIIFKTTPNKNYGLLQKEGVYYNLETGNRVNGYTLKTSSGKVFVHISPGVVNGNFTKFVAVTGHELIHAYHYITLGNNFNKILSESAAYDFTYNVYLSAGDLHNAWETLRTQLSIGYFKGIAPTYEVPFKHLFN